MKTTIGTGEEERCTGRRDGGCYVPIECRTPLNKRQLEGALNRVPPDFYSKGMCVVFVWILCDGQRISIFTIFGLS